MSRTTVLIFLFLVTGCGFQLEPAGTDVIGPEYTTGGGNWSSGGGITAVAKTFGRGGRTVLCGAWMTDRQSAMSHLYNEDVIAAASVYLGDTSIARNLSFMRRMPYEDNLTGKPANCVSSDLPWTEELSDAPLLLRFPRMSFGGFGSGFGAGAGGVGIGSGDRVNFREGPRPDPFR